MILQEREEAARRQAAEAEAQRKDAEDRLKMKREEELQERLKMKKEQELHATKSRALPLADAAGTAGDQSQDQWSLRVGICGAEHLPKMDLLGTCDAYVVLKIGRKEFKSKTVTNTYSPVWNEEFEFHLDSSYDREVLSLTVFDWDRNTKDDVIGYVSVPVSTLKSTGAVTKRQTMEILEQGSGKPCKGHDKKLSSLTLSFTGVLVRARVLRIASFLHCLSPRHHPSSFLDPSLLLQTYSLNLNPNQTPVNTTT